MSVLKGQHVLSVRDPSKANNCLPCVANPYENILWHIHKWENADCNYPTSYQTIIKHLKLFY